MVMASITTKCDQCGKHFKKSVKKSSREQANDWEILALQEKWSCAKCYKKQVEERWRSTNKESARVAAEKGLPKLKGSEKQVAWAETLRKEFVTYIEKTVEKIKVLHETDTKALRETIENDCGVEIDENDVKQVVIEVAQKSLSEKDKASFWIDNRSASKDRMFKKIIKEHFIKLEKECISFVPKEIEEESTISPENIKKEGIVKLQLDDNTMKAIYEKDDEFRKIVKDFRFKWNYENCCWERKLTLFTGAYEDRIGELGNQLLKAGFTIQILNHEALSKAINGDFIPECRRWISHQENDGKLIITFPRNDELYSDALNIKGAKYRNKTIKVDVMYYQQVLDYAECHNFAISEGAQRLIEKHKQKMSKIKVVTPQTVEKFEKKNNLESILGSEVAILDDLKD